ncbi:MaoC family dehydratase [Rhodococcus olei]|uniref:MaoC family dehydratase n=1 Tax=Rhodococcus olei TaxID=2161675 RepID=A0ABP8P3M6_9NOCA
MSDVKYAEDLTVGELIELGSHTVTESELVEFAGRWDPQDFHVDRAAAEQGWFGGLIASGVHSMAVLQRLSVLGVYRHLSVIGGRGLRDVRFRRPVRPGDTLTGTMRIDEVVLDDRGRGLVTSTGQLLGSDGAVVFSVVTEAYVRRRPTPDAS